MHKFYDIEAVEFALFMNESDDDTLPVVTFGSLQRALESVNLLQILPLIATLNNIILQMPLTGAAKPHRLLKLPMDAVSRVPQRTALHVAPARTKLYTSYRNTGGDHIRKCLYCRGTPTADMRAVQSGEASNSQPAVYIVVGGC